MTVKRTFDEIAAILLPMRGLACCRQRVGRRRSLSLGFGGKIFHKNKKDYLPDEFYGEWEFGTYSTAWRILNVDSTISCGSTDVADDFEDLNSKLAQLKLSNFKSIEMFSPIDVRVHLENGTRVEFLSTSDTADEIFHVFGPEHLFVEFSVVGGWKIGRSNSPKQVN